MSTPETDRALIVVAKAPRLGSVKTRLAQRLPPDAVVALYRALLDDTLRLARSVSRAHIALVCPAGDVADLQTLVGNGTPVVAQHGQGLAAALGSALEIFVHAGFGKVVVLDSDSPHLPPEVLESAFRFLDTHDVVIGPTEDGGYYLVGATAWHPLFETTDMGTRSAREQLATRASALGLSVAFTERCYDVDVAEDLARLAVELRASPERAPSTGRVLATIPTLLGR